jgi:large subunit ribosomal protein L31
LSDDVWTTTSQYPSKLEKAGEVGVGEGEGEDSERACRRRPSGDAPGEAGSAEEVWSFAWGEGCAAGSGESAGEVAGSGGDAAGSGGDAAGSGEIAEEVVGAGDDGPCRRASAIRWCGSNVRIKKVAAQASARKRRRKRMAFKASHRSLGVSFSLARGCYTIAVVKEKIHPTWYPEARIHCACGSAFTTGSTLKVINVEICSACHPLFTGQQKLIDTAGRVDKFNQRAALAEKKQAEAAERRRRKEQEAAAASA